jgi:hypothetical protein
MYTFIILCKLLVLDKLSDVGKKDKLLKFFKLVQDGKFPLNNTAFELFLDIVEWFDRIVDTIT